MNFLSQLWNDLREAWRRLSLSARVNILLAGLAVIAVVVLVVVLGSRGQYVTLSSNLSPEDLTKVVDVLEGQGVPYELRDGNQTVLVPVEHRSKMQLALAGENLPVGRGAAPGFELFQQSDLMTNEWMQNVQFMRAVQGELQRLLNNLDFVEDSYVLIREADESLFASEQQPSEAAVVLKLRRIPNRNEIKAIVNMISRAGGPHLHPDNITVMTTDMQVLHDPSDGEFASLANTKLEYLAELERMREKRVQEALERMGVRGTVRVSAKVDFDEKETQEKKAAEGTELSTYTVSTTSTSADVLPEGAPGALANVPEGASAGGMQTSEETTEEITNYEPSLTTTTTRKGPGDVLQYLVTLVVQGKYGPADDQGVRPYLGIEETDRQMYEDLAKAAVGEGSEATTVVVHDYPFDLAALGGPASAMDQMQPADVIERYGQYIWYGVQMLLLLVGFFFLRRLLRRAISVRREEEEEEVAELPTMTPEEKRQQEVAEEISELSRTQPEAVSQLLRSWLNAEEE